MIPKVSYFFVVICKTNDGLTSSLFVELQLMFRLIDRVQGGIEPMLKYLEEHITSTGLADMIAAACIITQVKECSVLSLFIIVQEKIVFNSLNSRIVKNT